MIIVIVAVGVVGGCPQSGREAPATLEAHITASVTQGTPPLLVVFSAASSGSADGTIDRIEWDFAGEASSDEVQSSHVFRVPGRRTVLLTVFDVNGGSATARQDIRVTGGPVQAVISADPLSGPAPLLVLFDGRASTAAEDRVLDYFWDFGDGETARNSAPAHLFSRGGSYSVTLRAVSGGGVEGSTQLTIQVDTTSSGSLQFNGSQFAALPVGVGDALDAFTFDAWIKPSETGGSIVSFGDPLVTIRVSASSNTIDISSGTLTISASAFELADRWSHVAVTKDADDQVVIYLDGAPITSGVLAGSFAIDELTLGSGYRGNIARVRISSSAASVDEIAGGGISVGLFGSWALDEGRGQTLNNSAGGAAGTLGGNNGVETADPAWSSDGP